MKLQKIIAPTMQKAILEAHKTLGLDALIYSSHETATGVEMVVGLPDTASNAVFTEVLPESENQHALFNQIQHKLENLRENMTVMQQYLMENLKYPGKEKPKREQLVASHLQAKGFSGILFDRLLASYLGRQRVIRQIRKEVMQECMQECIALAPMEVKGKKNACYALVGATGVGKTTSICKLAKYFVDRHGAQKVGVITLDPQDMTIKNQLNHHCDQLQIELQYASDATSLQSSLTAMKSKSIILIDTFGCGPNEQKSIAKIAALFKKHEFIQTILALPCNLQSISYEQLFASFSHLTLQGAILTKMDETDFIAPVLSQIVKASLPLAYISAGQSIKDTKANYPDMDLLADKLYTLDN